MKSRPLTGICDHLLPLREDSRRDIDAALLQEAGNNRCDSLEDLRDDVRGDQIIGLISGQLLHMAVSCDIAEHSLKARPVNSVLLQIFRDGRERIVVDICPEYARRAALQRENAEDAAARSSHARPFQMPRPDQCAA